ncbi:hypothetical protein [Levilactobacillus fujinensis]|uniref:D-alanyl-D-alanine carboxypeptidase n=2 Tax=Levilactobacillus fujinensis TaxID=2486024 RepID=A0ABW1TEU1_9LACO|nr:hypothetical protein [Levilactobacillus fujinensis]
MRWLSMGLVLGVAILNAFWGTEQVGSASSQYSAQRSNSVKLIWRHRMGKHVFHTVKGARYSQHLGVRYSENSDLPDVTWVTDAHEKLYRKAKGSSAIYYHVKSADGQHGGWIWRGYLTAGTVPVQTGPDPERPRKAEIPAVSLYTAKSSVAYARAIQTEPVYRLSKAVWQLFPGTKLNLELSRMAIDFPSENGLRDKGMLDKKHIIHFDLGNDWGTFQDTRDQPLTTRLTWLKKRLAQQGLPATKRQSLQGWSIGLDFVDDFPAAATTDEDDVHNVNQKPHGDADEHPLHYAIVLISPERLHSFQAAYGDQQ